MSYAAALYELSEEENCTGDVYEAAVILQEALCCVPSYLRFLAAPAIPMREKKELLWEFMQDMPLLLQRTVYILCENNEIVSLVDILDAYLSFYKEQKGIVEVVVITAVKLSNHMKSNLTGILQRRLCKDVLLKEQLDPSCLGGLKIQISNRQYDYSITGRLEAIGQLLAEGVPDFQD